MEVLTIAIRTGFREKVGLNTVDEAVDVDEVLDKMRSSDADYYIILPDILLSYRDYARKLVKKYWDRDLVILTGKPRSVFSGLLKSLAYNPLSLFTGDNLGLAVIISKRLLLKARNARSPRELLEAATFVTKVVYREPVADYIYMVYGKLPKPLVVTLLEPFRMLKFALVGLSGVVINLLAITATLALVNLHSYVHSVLLASIIGFEVSLTWNFLLHESWTFKDLKLNHNPGAVFGRWVKYHLGSLGSLFTQSGTITLLTGVMGVEVYESVLLGVTLGFIVNYLVGRLYTWTD